MTIATFDSNADVPPIVATLRRDGPVIVTGLIDGDRAPTRSPPNAMASSPPHPERS